MSYDGATKEFVRFASYVGMVCERASHKLENTSNYNDTRDDVFDGYFDACINATDIVWFGGVFSESDFNDEIAMADAKHNEYAKTPPTITTKRITEFIAHA